MDSLSPVCRWRAEPRVQATSPESPGRQVQTSSSCSPSETAWRTGGWRIWSPAGPKGASGGPRALRGDTEDGETRSPLRSSEGHWLQIRSDQPEIMRAEGEEGGGMRAADSPCGSSWRGDTSLVLMGGFTAGNKARTFYPGPQRNQIISPGFGKSSRATWQNLFVSINPSRALAGLQPHHHHVNLFLSNKNLQQCVCVDDKLMTNVIRYIRKT